MNPDASISENVSVNRPRRGRPSKFTDKGYEKLAEYVTIPAGATRRTKQNWIYAVLAALNLRAERFSYLFTPGWRTTILTELGKMQPDDHTLMLGCAEIICANKMKTARAVAWARRLRYPKKRTDRHKLWLAIQRAIEKHRAAYPGQLSNQDVADVLEKGAPFYQVMP